MLLIIVRMCNNWEKYHVKEEIEKNVKNEEKNGKSIDSRKEL